ncbi:NAD(P)/FAD-dependent oxidoreductase [Methylomarinum vadi]|uniref:NAD(P)/FAD-dependent oxidoreductase n=1 Tax=Methylomarinum vadi TaxID=438855 RepID=UPI001F39547B|nr:FAD-binding oxidoreductase [Methylomarinum vadi]
MNYHTVVIGGGCLGCACAFSIQKRLGKKAGQVAIVEKKVLGAGLSSRHSAIVRSANASPMAARMAKQATAYWKKLKPLWGIDMPFEQSGAIWIAANQGRQSSQKWSALENAMAAEDIDFRMLSHLEVEKLCGKAIKIVPEENYYYEPEVLQLDSSQILNAIQSAARRNKIDVIEHCEVVDFSCDSRHNIEAIKTNQGEIRCQNIVNATGAWSAELFAGMDIEIPVALEPVYAANFLLSTQDIPVTLPIIADFVNRAYFRRWRGSILHMHQPRSRSPKDIASSFSRALMNPEGANVIYDASSFNVNYQQLEDYLLKVQQRFPNIGRPVYAGGYRSFFDITPDLKFILGPDHRSTNLYHCLGAGQSLKYAPIFGEIIARLITGTGKVKEDIDITEFSIERFSKKPISDFWQGTEQDAQAL